MRGQNVRIVGQNYTVQAVAQQMHIMHQGASVGSMNRGASCLESV